MRLRPKSKARTVRAWVLAERACSGMSRRVLQTRVAEAEQLHRGGQPLFGRRFEDDAVARLDGEPGVLRQLVLELARRPAGVAERDEQPLRTLAAPDRFQDVLRRG